MANMIILYRQGKKVFASKLEGEVEEFVESGDSNELSLDGEDWSPWVGLEPYDIEWESLEDCIDLTLLRR